MASKKAKAFLRSMGIDCAHTAREAGNFSVGTGAGRYPMPYQVIRMDSRTGDSKATMGWYPTLDDARDDARAMMLADDKTDDARGGAESMRNRYRTYYVRDIRTDRIYRS
jgi:hypothetical protein